VAITCAAIGVDARDLDLPVPLDRTAYRRAVDRLTARGLVEEGRLTAYGREVEAMPVERPWGEMLVHAEDDLVPVVAVCSNVDSLHRMTRDERDLHGLVAGGSDHLTAYNVYADAVNHAGRLGEVYGLPRHVFDEDALAEWAEARGVLVKAIEDVALGTASVYRSLELPLPVTLPHASKEVRRRFAELVARIQPFDLVIDERTVDGQEARVSRTSVAGSWGAVAGTLRFFADRFGVPRAGIEGTTLSYDLIRQHATEGRPRVVISGPRKHPQLAVERRVEYFGFELETAVEPIRGPVPEALQGPAREALVEALLAGEAQHPDQGWIRRSAWQLDEYWRRSGGTLPEAAPGAVRRRLLGQLDGVSSWDDFQRATPRLQVEEIVDEATRSRLDALPMSVRLLGDTLALEYALEHGAAVVRLHLREGQARRLRTSDLPALDRPIRFEVQQGRRPPIIATTLPELEESLRKAEKSGRREREQRGGRDDRGGRGGRGGGLRGAGPRRGKGRSGGQRGRNQH
jgi:hypothetical protein